MTNKPKWLIMTQSVLCGNQDLEIRSDVSSFSGWDAFSKFKHFFFHPASVKLKHYLLSIFSFT